MRLECEGDLSLLNMPRRALLVSRDTRNPAPDQPWVRQVVAAVQKIASREEILVTSIGTLAYDVALFSCFNNRGSGVIVLQGPPAANDSWKEWLPVKHLLVYPAADTPVKLNTSTARDLLVGWIADRAHIIFVRPNGNMAAVADLLRSRGCPVDEDFACEKKKTARPPKHLISAQSPLKVDQTTWNYLTHFTREPDGAWPGESRNDYLRWLCSGDSAPRNAFAALCRILSQRRIIACGRLMPDHTPMVCFTAVAPDEARTLNIWRRGLRRWSFTPYGLAIRKAALAQVGARAVQYATENEIKTAQCDDRRYLQRKFSGDLNWSREAEWRLTGDLDLSQFKPEQLLALVETREQATHVTSEYGIEVWAGKISQKNAQDVQMP